MVDLKTFNDLVTSRQQTFRANINALNYRLALVDIAASYMDLMTSNYGESYWEEDALCAELDDVFERLKKANRLFRGRPISDRRTDKDDPNVITYKTVEEKFKNTTDESGNKLKISLGEQPVIKKKHVHSETIEIKNFGKTNILGIPKLMNVSNCTLHKGFYPYISKFTGQAQNVNENADTLRVRTYTARTFENYAKHPRIKEIFFDEIVERMKYGLADLFEIFIDDNIHNGVSAGLIRTDYDIEDGTPVCERILICLNTSAFILGHIDGTNLVEDVKDFIVEKLVESDLIISSHCQVRIFAEGGVKALEEVLAKTKANQAAKVADYIKYKQAAKETAEQALIEEEERMAREAAEHAAERARQREERAKERAEQAAQRAADREARKARQHEENVHNAMNGIVQTILSQGKTPGKAAYQIMLDSVIEDVQEGVVDIDSISIFKEALEKLIELDTNE